MHLFILDLFSVILKSVDPIPFGDSITCFAINVYYIKYKSLKDDTMCLLAKEDT